MKKTIKNEGVKKDVERQIQGYQPVPHATSHAPSRQVVEEATKYAEDRFGRALIRLSDR